MAVRIRMKKMGRRHRPFFRICAVDARAPRDGRVIEELGHYDPMLTETDARAVLNGERIDYWLGVGAQPSEKVKVLIDKYGTNGSHLEQQRQAQERVKLNKPTAPPPRAVPKKEEPKKEEPKAEEPKVEQPKVEQPKVEEPKVEQPKAAEEAKAAAATEAQAAEAKPSEGGE